MSDLRDRVLGKLERLVCWADDSGTDGLEGQVRYGLRIARREIARHRKDSEIGLCAYCMCLTPCPSIVDAARDLEIE